MIIGFRKFELLIAKRYQKSKSEGAGTNAVTKIALFGITLAVFALVSTLSVRAGFRDEFLKTLLGANPHITISIENKEITTTQDIIERAVIEQNVQGAFPIVTEQVILAANGIEGGAEIIGIQASDLRSIPLIADPKDYEGSLVLKGDNIAVGRGVADSLKITVGDRIRVVLPSAISKDSPTSKIIKNEFRPALTADSLSEINDTDAGIKEFRVSYIFEVGREEIDQTRIYMDLEEARIFFDRKVGVDAVHILLFDPNSTLPVKYSLAGALSEDFSIVTWKEASATLLAALALQDRAMFIILGILVLIASLNIVSGLVMLVKTKSRDIGILRTMGLSKKAILRVFFMCGAYVGVFGTTAGIALGVIFSLNIDLVMEHMSVFVGHDPEMVGVEPLKLTAKLRLVDILGAGVGSLLVCFLITFFPARKAANLNPIDALRDD